MSFDKKEYWDRRNHTYEVKVEGTDEVTVIKAPMRGQTDKTPEPVLVEKSGIELVMIKDKPYFFNRKQRRTRLVNRLYCKKGYRNGVKIKNER